MSKKPAESAPSSRGKLVVGIGIGALAILAALYLYRRWKVETVKPLPAEGPMELWLPNTRFEQTPILSRANLGTVWEQGDYTLTGIYSDNGLRVDVHSVVGVGHRPHVLVFESDELNRLKAIIHQWRPDDVLHPTELEWGFVRVEHRLTGQSVVGKHAYEF
ncbi:MAG: hypothetical protein AB7F31_05240 [Parachlamydiales bacterium]